MVTAAEMKEIERRATESGLSYDAMMDNAGRAAAGVLLERVPALRTLAVFCGRGNNGGDGFVVAREAAARGAKVLVVLTDGEPSTDCARHAFDAMGLPAKLLAELSDAEFAFVKGADAVADAVIGTGFRGELRPNAAAAAQLMNEAHGLVLALDVPTGVETDTGRCAGGAVRADVTVTFHDEKPCHALARDMCGDVVTADIGIRL